MYREDDNSPFYFKESPITECIGLGKQSFCLVAVLLYNIKKTVNYVKPNSSRWVGSWHCKELYCTIRMAPEVSIFSFFLFMFFFFHFFLNINLADYVFRYFRKPQNQPYTWGAPSLTWKRLRAYNARVLRSACKHGMVWGSVRWCLRDLVLFFSFFSFVFVVLFHYRNCEKHWSC